MTSTSPEDNSEYYDIEEEAWRITWIMAFPTLLPHLMYYFNNTGDSSNEKITTTKNHIKTNDDGDAKKNIHVAYSLLAYREIFGDLSGQKTMDDIVGRSSSPIVNISETEDIEDEEIISSDTENLGYGEITPKTIMSILSHLRRIYPKQFFSSEEEKKEKSGIIVDLGSGTARVLFASSLIHNFEYCIGVEIVKELHLKAMDNLEKWNNKRHVYVDGERGIENDDVDDYSERVTRNNNKKNDDEDNLLKQSTKFIFLNEDLRNYISLLKAKTTSSLLIQKANVVIIHATVFSDTFMKDTIEPICMQMKTGALFIMISKRLMSSSASDDDTNMKFFETIHEGEYDMTWGKGTVYIQQRI